ncbi:hypothetical protein HQ529_00775 [Candidatus Woesearchaeota archaeon]|nr:hypothetical protein [Candidatus Woesearchaeota archaeon]
MKKKSVQQIEDSYINLGYKGDKLRKAVEKDKEYKNILKEKKQRLTKRFRITSQEKKKYVMATDSDFEILGKCKQLEKLRLTKEDRSLVKLLKTQLEDDWRTPLIKFINKLMKKYK